MLVHWSQQQSLTYSIKTNAAAIQIFYVCNEKTMNEKSSSIEREREKSRSEHMKKTNKSPPSPTLRRREKQPLFCNIVIERFCWYSQNMTRCSWNAGYFFFLDDDDDDNKIITVWSINCLFVLLSILCRCFASHFWQMCSMDDALSRCLWTSFRS